MGGICSLIIPESPRWLSLTGDAASARRALARLRDNTRQQDMLEAELAAMEAATAQHQHIENGSDDSNNIRVRFHIIRNARIENVGKSQSCMVSELPIIWKQTV